MDGSLLHLSLGLFLRWLPCGKTPPSLRVERHPTPPRRFRVYTPGITPEDHERNMSQDLEVWFPGTLVPWYPFGTLRRHTDQIRPAVTTGFQGCNRETPCGPPSLASADKGNERSRFLVLQGDTRGRPTDSWLLLASGRKSYVPHVHFWLDCGDH